MLTPAERKRMCFFSQATKMIREKADKRERKLKVGFLSNRQRLNGLAKELTRKKNTKSVFIQLIISALNIYLMIHIYIRFV